MRISRLLKVLPSRIMTYLCAQAASSGMRSARPYLRPFLFLKVVERYLGLTLGAGMPDMY